MQFQILVAVSIGLLASACHSPSERTAIRASDNTPAKPVTSEFPNSHLDARGYRVDAGSYYTPSEAEKHNAGQTGVSSTPPRTGGNGPVAWTSKGGYSYDQWGNLISTPR